MDNVNDYKNISVKNKDLKFIIYITTRTSIYNLQDLINLVFNNNKKYYHDDKILQH